MEQDTRLGVAWARNSRRAAAAVAGVLAVAAFASGGVRAGTATTADAGGAHVTSMGMQEYIVEGASVHALHIDVARAGGRFVQALPVVHGVLARLSPTQAHRLGEMSGVRVTIDGSVTVAAVTDSEAATPVPLGTASSFAVLAGSAVTNTGATTLNGDLGSYPTPTITGTATLSVTGTDQGGDAVTQSAKTDLVTAYDDAAGEGATSPISADLGGQRLTPGVYNSASSIGLTGVLTLDGGGDPGAVFVFQAGSTLTTASASQVVLTGGAQACNVFWQVGSSATLGTGSSFTGTVLAFTSITATTGVSVDGRLLASNGAVTLDTNDVETPTCTAATSTTAPPATTTTTTPAAATTITPPATTAPPAAATSITATTAPPASTGPVENFQELTGASELWAQGDEGQGVSVAVLDTGIDASLPDFGGRVIDGVDLTGGSSPYTDEYGHGTFIAGLIAGYGASSGGNYTGEAPEANLVSIKVAGANGLTNESTVIEGIGWAISHAGAPDNIRVLNLSLGVAPSGPAAEDPLDQAAEAAWDAGITVVASAGNNGPTNGSIASPGDDPLIITVGALDTTAGTTPGSWQIPAFSSVGPTEYDGSFKPDVVAPGRSVVSVADPGSTIYEENPSAVIGSGNFVGSGTSFSAAITSGEVALMLEKNPGATPDEVKGALLLTASEGPASNPFVDGHGATNVALAAQIQGPSLNQAPAVSAEQNPSATVSLASSWVASTWNPANWSAPSWSAAVAGFEAEPGATWNDTTWNGAAWNGLDWNGAAWNGAAWNGAAWNGAFWNGAAWNGAAWNGAAWNGAAWNGAAWNGAAWNGAAWNGAAWNGAAWNGAAWNGAN